jgi:MoaA/NifB/PqqE/SkfB family radical SAM enzyme
MCYFTDDEKRMDLPKGKFNLEDLPKLADAFFSRAVKLQIGCGAEPSLFLYNIELIRLAVEKKVPYIAMTTNANRYSEKEWRELVTAGLNEVTLSMHGVTKETYEYFMVGGNYETFCSSLKVLSDLKKEFPKFKIRINYTANKDNLHELVYFFEIFGNYNFDILQIRPILEMAKNSSYNDFSWDEIYKNYDLVIEKLKNKCIQNHITFLTPSKHDLTKKENTGSVLLDSTYIYISPKTCWRDDFDFRKDTYDSYGKRNNLGLKLLLKVFQKDKDMIKTKKGLNYRIY